MMSDSLQVGQLSCVIFSAFSPSNTTGSDYRARRHCLCFSLRSWFLFCNGCRLARSRISGLGVVQDLQVVRACSERGSPFSPGSRVFHFAELLENGFFFACRSLRLKWGRP